MDPTPGCRFHPDSSAVPLHDLLHHGKTDSGSLVLVAVQPLEDAEDLFDVFWLDSDTIVAHAEHNLIRPLARCVIRTIGRRSPRYLIAFAIRF